MFSATSSISFSASLWAYSSARASSFRLYSSFASRYAACSSGYWVLNFLFSFVHFAAWASLDAITAWSSSCRDSRALI